MANMKKLLARRRELLNQYDYAQAKRRGGPLLGKHAATLLSQLDRTDTLIDQQERLNAVMAERKRTNG